MKVFRRTVESSSVLVLILLMCAMWVGGIRTSANSNEAALQNCGPDQYAPVVEFQKKNGRTQKTTRKATIPYESFASYQFASSADGPGDNARKVDEFGKTGWCDVQAHLDNFAVELQNEPNAKGYIIVHRSYDDKAVVTMNKVMAGFAQDYLVKSRGIDPSRIVTINGPRQEDLSVELLVGQK